MAKVFVNRVGKAIHEVEWKNLRGNPAYFIVRQFDNGAVRVVLEWTGQCERGGFPSYRQLYKLFVHNYNSEGVLVRDPADDGKTFTNEEVALAGYEAFLLRWSESTTDDANQFVELGNTLAQLEYSEPPPPKTPDQPNIEPDEPELGNVGAW